MVTRPSVCPKCTLSTDNSPKERDPVTSQTCLPTFTWFLLDEDGRPVGQIRRSELPEAGMDFEEEGRFEQAEIVEVVELRPSCSMRRFRVIIRIIR